MFSTSKTISTLIFGLLLSSATYAKSVTVHATMSPAGSFDITSKKIKGSISKNGDILEAKNISVPVSSLKTDLEPRDEHMYERLEKDKHPSIKIVAAKGQGGRGQAIIEIKGVQKKISFTYQEKGSECLVEFSLSLADFQIKDLTYVGVGVDDKVTVKAEIPIK